MSDERLGSQPRVRRARIGVIAHQGREHVLVEGPRHRSGQGERAAPRIVLPLQESLDRGAARVADRGGIRRVLLRERRHPDRQTSRDREDDLDHAVVDDALARHQLARLGLAERLQRHVDQETQVAGPQALVDRLPAGDRDDEVRREVAVVPSSTDLSQSSSSGPVCSYVSKNNASVCGGRPSRGRGRTPV